MAPGWKVTLLYMLKSFEQNKNVSKTLPLKSFLVDKNNKAYVFTLSLFKTYWELFAS